MDTTLKPYSEYKTTDQEWLGKVPLHWKVLPNRALFDEIKDQNYPDESLLSVTISRGVIPQKVLLANSSKKDSSSRDKSKYKLVQVGDIVYNKMRAWQGALGISKYRGIVSPAYVVVRPRLDIEPRFYHYLLRTPNFVGEAERWSYGITSDMWSLRHKDFKQIYCVLPPVSEQRKIAQFLDHKNHKVNRLIRIKQRLIELLNEQKQAIIQRAVTRGLDPDVPLKPSGVDWLGDVPVHWDVIALKRITSSRCDGPFGSGLKSSHYSNAGRRVIRLQNIRCGVFNDGPEAFIPESHYSTLGDHDVVHGDLLIAGLGDSNIPAGRACVAPAGIEPAMVKADCFRFRIKKGAASPHFLARHLSATALFASQVLSRGATRLRINLQVTASRPIALPPFDEQIEILRFIQSETRPLERSIQTISREIECIREYRTRLIADVVTGKLDVRGIEVPDEVDGKVDQEVEFEEELVEAVA